jgi:D-alanyl-D-alanine carboxypeptidase
VSKAGRRPPVTAVLALALTMAVAAGAAVALATRPRGPAAAPSTARPAPGPSSTSPGGATRASPSLPPDTILAWTPGGLAPGFAAAVAGTPGVSHVVVVRSGTVWLARTSSASGSVVSRPPAGMFIPVEVASANPDALRPFWPPALRPGLGALARGRALLGSTSARMRRLGPGGVLVFSHAPAGRTLARVEVGGVVPDAAVGAAEVFVAPAMARSLGVTRARYLLVDPAADARPGTIERAIRDVAPPGVALRLRRRGQTPFLRQGDAVLAPVMVKRLFGEFDADPTANAGGWFTMDPAWVRADVATASVPILGRVTCNRRILPQLRAALRQVRSAGLSGLIDPGDYGGCYTPRLLTAADPSVGPGHHAWGIAIDINVSRNPFGGTPTQDPRVVAIFRRWGFTWGGRWLVPDGMHFEAARIVPVPGA